MKGSVSRVQLKDGRQTIPRSKSFSSVVMWSFHVVSVDVLRCRGLFFRQKCVRVRRCVRVGVWGGIRWPRTPVDTCPTSSLCLPPHHDFFTFPCLPRTPLCPPIPMSVTASLFTFFLSSTYTTSLSLTDFIPHCLPSPTTHVHHLVCIPLPPTPFCRPLSATHVTLSTFLCLPPTHFRLVSSTCPHDVVCCPLCMSQFVLSFPLFSFLHWGEQYQCDECRPCVHLFVASLSRLLLVIRWLKKLYC